MNHFAYEKILDFDNLYAAYKASRRSKRRTREVVKFELNPGPNLCALRQELLSGTYRLSGYYHFTIHDPKTRSTPSTTVTASSSTASATMSWRRTSRPT